MCYTFSLTMLSISFWGQNAPKDNTKGKWKLGGGVAQGYFNTITIFYA